MLLAVQMETSLPLVTSLICFDHFRVNDSMIHFEDLLLSLLNKIDLCQGPWLTDAYSSVILPRPTTQSITFWTHTWSSNSLPLSFPYKKIAWNERTEWTHGMDEMKSDEIHWKKKEISSALWKTGVCGLEQHQPCDVRSWACQSEAFLTHGIPKKQKARINCLKIIQNPQKNISRINFQKHKGPLSVLDYSLNLTLRVLICTAKNCSLKANKIHENNLRENT